MNPSIQSITKFLASVQRNSTKSKCVYEIGLRHFQVFLEQKYSMKYNKIEAILNLVSRGELNVYELLDDFVENLIFINPDRFNYRSSKKSYRLLSIHLKITLLLLLLLLLLTPFDLNCAVCAQQAVFGQDSSENTSGETADRLDTIIELLKQSRQGSITQLYLTIIVFMMGLAFVIFGLYIGQEQRLSIFTRRLYLIAYFALVIPITVILVQYIVNTLLSGALDDPVLNVAFLLLIPVTASYILMLVKSRHDIVKRS